MSNLLNYQIALPVWQLALADMVAIGIWYGVKALWNSRKNG